MRINAAVGDKLFRIGCGDGAQQVGWLQGELVRRYQKKHGVTLRVRELRTLSNVVLDPDDQIFDVLKDNDTVLAVLIEGQEFVQPGDMFQSRYFVVRKLAEGTYGEVFIAKDLNLERQVAIKVLKRSKANELNMKRFMREARLMAALSQHPNIVPVYDFGRTESGMFYIVMSLLHGRPMDEWLEERMKIGRPVTEIECLQIFIPILDGLDMAHSHQPPIIHRDLKPDNVFLCHSDFQQHSSSVPLSVEVHHYVPKIMDFGIAILNEEDAKKKTLACGTRMYASPEQTQNGSHINCCSDIWSCGVMMYQCVSLLAEMPFDPIQLVLNRGWVPDVALHTKTPLTEPFRQLIMKTLQKNPDDRFQSVREMREAMVRILSQHRAQPSSLSPLSRSPPNYETSALWRVLVSFLSFYRNPIF
eukprot:TRINITY_DN12894_c0_g1_i6.p1 TRINITY_DN12894_c0_g1~~TRINITY_DN12894_c0_g1_i6.p1  ORF type:complete len:416 (+),score=47.69 TRINITY_DN12894_c0_g1_i6:72-1319(+)